MKGFRAENKSKKTNKIKYLNNEIINKAFKSHSEGNISEAAKYYQQIIRQGCIDPRVFSNYGVILKNLGKLKEAEISTRKAIELNPNYSQGFLNLGLILKDLNNLQDAEISTRKGIKLNPKNANGYSNLGGILQDLGKLKDAEASLKKAIQLKSNLAGAYSNLGSVLKDLGKLKDAEVSLKKAIQLNPNLTKAYFSLSSLKYANEINSKWQKNLFLGDILKNKFPKEKVDIYFARANILHNKKKYDESSKYLKFANKLKIEINPSDSNFLINKSKALLIESDKKEIHKKIQRPFSNSIFIVGMPRSGSTLLESILSMNNDVYDLGEINILEESFLESKESNKELNLADIYEKKVKDKTNLKITTNKYLYNYQYAGVIAKNIPNSKIIHCIRNPLDNILSIFRAHFAKGNTYASSLVDCANIYLNQEAIMSEYKNRFRPKIYDLNYDFLVMNPKQEIKSLIFWLGWKWDDNYLTPHLNPRSVSTASNVQVRSPINTKSLRGWQKYKKMLKPAMEIITQNDKYKDLKY